MNFILHKNKNLSIKIFLAATILILLSLPFAGCGNSRTYAISELSKIAGSLDGKRIRVRGQAYLWLEPSVEEMWGFGGCAINLDGSPSTQGVVIGWLTLYD